MTLEMHTNRTVLPPKDQRGLKDLDEFVSKVADDGSVSVEAGDQRVPLPKEAVEVLRSVIDAMREGKAITVAPMDQMLTTQEAANFLGVSRPTFVRLLEREEIPYEFTTGGRHRRVKLTDVLRYQASLRKRRREILDDLTAEASEHGLYGVDASAYAEALKEARTKGKKR